MDKKKPILVEINSLPIEPERKVPMNIALSADDKQFLKLYAIKHDTNVSALIAAYVKMLRDTEQ